MAPIIEVIELDSDDDTNAPSRAPWETPEVEEFFDALNHGDADLHDPQNMNPGLAPAPDVPYGFARPFPHGHDGTLEPPLPRIGERFSGHHVSISSHDSSSGLPRDQSANTISSDYDLCLIEILELFPDISHDHVKHLYDSELQGSGHNRTQTLLLQHLIDKILDSGKYPKERDRLKELKRKRYLDSDEEELAELQNAQNGDTGYAFDVYASTAKMVLQEDFVNVPSRFIDLKFKENGQYIKTFQALELADREWEANPNPTYQRLKHPRKPSRTPQDIELHIDNMAAQGYGVAELKREIAAARRQRQKTEVKQQAKKAKDAAEQAKDKEYRDKGDVMDCSICWDSTPTYKVIACNSEKTSHFTCFGCINDHAKSCIGDQKWELLCPDTSGCQASFSRSERKRALSAKTLETLDRIQQQSELLQASMADLSRCPFCDFAAICPPIEVDWEFRCGNPQCERISCRRCDKDTHAPKTCKEAREDQGLDERHAIEEARSAAVIKKCSCGRPIVKLAGCNKVKCYCGRTICDFCGEDLTQSGYNHFAGEGGLQNILGGKCPLYDDSAKRNDQNAKAAEEKAKKKIRAENPNLSEADLEIKFKDEVQGSPHGPFPGGMGFPGRHHGPLPPLPPRVAAGPLNHEYPMFPQNGPGLGYGPHMVGPPVGPRMYPQNGPYDPHVIGPPMPHGPPINPMAHGRGAPLMDQLGGIPRHYPHGAPVQPHGRTHDHHHRPPPNEDRRAAPVHHRRHAVRAGEWPEAFDFVGQHLDGNANGTRHRREERHGTTGKAAGPGSTRKEKR